MICALTSIVLALVLQAAPAAAKPAAKGSISGVVTHAGTGDPVAGVKVILAKTDMPEGATSLDAQSRNNENPAAEMEMSVGMIERLKNEWGARREAGPPQLAVFNALPLESARSILIDPSGKISLIPRNAPPMVTDAGGRFTFANLEPGTYRLIFVKNGFVRQDYGQRAAGARGTPIAVESGQSVENIVMRLVPTGALSGRVTDTMGQPVAGAPVQLARLTYNAAAKKQTKTLASTETDDRGEYRFYFITPGRYYLSAGGGPDPEGNPLLRVNDGFESDDPVPDVGFDPLLSQLGLPGQNAPNRIHQVFGVTFYPGAASATSAAPVEVTSGSDISGMDIVVNPSGRYTVRGFVIDERTGRPPEVASLNLLPAEGEPLSQFTGAPRPPRPDLQPD